jgi:uncharacterized protein YndB with AHSA1/START domain
MEGSIVIEMVYPQSIDQVWEALTSREALAAWLMPNDFEPRTGHRFTFRTAPDQHWSGTVYCEVVELDAQQHRLAFTWQGGALDTLVTFSLQSADGGTHLRLEHTGFEKSGDAGLTIRDMLASGWNSRILRERLPDYLNAHHYD